MAIEFDDANSELLSLAGSGIISMASAFSITAWVKNDDNTHNVIYNQAASSVDTQTLSMDSFENTLRYVIKNDAGTEITASLGTINDSTWAHCAFTWDGSNEFNLYLNGAGTTFTTNMPATYTFTRSAIGVFYRLNPTGYTDGRYEDVRLYQKELSSNQIAILANGYRDLIGGEIGRWAMNTAPGITNWDTASLGTTNVIPDESTASNNGTPINTLTARASEAPRMAGYIHE